MEGGRKGEGSVMGKTLPILQRKEETAVGEERERLSTCSVVNVSCKLRQECIMEV